MAVERIVEKSIKKRITVSPDEVAGIVLKFYDAPAGTTLVADELGNWSAEWNHTPVKRAPKKKADAPSV
jgi:hypothetical protein